MTNHSYFTKRMFRTGNPVFTCRVCHKQTRDTGNDEEALQLCKRCLFEAYVENAESDYGVNSEEAQRARAHLAALGPDLQEDGKRAVMNRVAQPEVPQPTHQRSMTMSDNNATTENTASPTPEKKARKPRKDKGVKKGSKSTKTKTKTKTAEKKSTPKAKPEKKSTPKAKPEKKGGAVFDSSVRAKYTVHVLKDAEGHKVRTIDNNDAVSKKLRGEPLEKLYSLCRDATGTPKTELEQKYGKLNVGMQAMNLRNRIRAAVARGDYKLPA